MLAQYGTPESPVHAVCPAAHDETHAPATQLLSDPHAMPHPPQFFPSLSASAQKGTPASDVHRSCPATHVEAQWPTVHTCWAPHATPHAPQLLPSVCVLAQ